MAESDGFPDQPGEFQVRSCKDSEGTYDRMWFVCPRNPEQTCGVPILPRRNPNGAGWSWDPKTQSLTPSINCAGKAGCGWHGFITNGEIR